MPGLDGLAAAREITAERQAAVLILTAFSQRDLIEQARDAGALAYLVKPFQKSELIPAVEVALGRFREMQALFDQNTSLEEQLETRKVVDRAKGLLMDGHGLSRVRCVLVDPEAGHAGPPDDAGGGRRGDRGRAGARGLSTPVPRTVLLIDGNSLTYRALLRAAHRPRHRVGAGHQRGVRVHVDAREHPAGHQARRASRSRSTCPSRRSATSGSAPTRARATRRRTSCASRWGSCARSSRRLRIPILEAPGFEADDIIATLATQGRDAGDDVVSSSPATATPTSSSRTRTSRCCTSSAACPTSRVYDEAGIQERTGVTPGALPAVRRAPRRPVRQPARRPRRGGEDGGQAHHHLRRARRDLRAPRRADARSSARTWPPTRPTCARTTS